MAVKIGSLIGVVGLDIGRWDEGIAKMNKRVDAFKRRSSRAFKSVRGTVNRLGGGITSLAAKIAVLAGPTAIGALTVSSMRAIDAQQKFADVVGTTQAKLAGLQLAAAELSGVADSTLNMALQRMTRRLAEAAVGTGEAKDAIASLGIDARKFAAMDPADAFAAIGDELAKIEDEGTRLRIAFKLLDSEGARLVTTMAAGSKVLTEYEEKAKRLGIAFTRIETKKIEAANDAMLVGRKAASALGNTIALEVSPFIKDLAERWTEATLKSEGFKDAVTTGMNASVDAIGFVLDAINGVSVAWAGAEVAVRGVVAGVVNLATLQTRIANAAANFGRDLFGKDEVPFEETGVGKFVKLYNDALDDAVDKFNQLAATNLPSVTLKRWVASIREADAALDDVIDEVTVLGKPGVWVKVNDRINEMGTKFEDVSARWDEGLAGMRDALVRNLQQMVSDIIASGIRDLLFGSVSGKGAGGFFKTLFGAGAGGGGAAAAAPGAARGMDTMVGGSGGTDQNLALLRLTKGERVQVTPAGAGGGGGGGNVTIIEHNDFRGRNPAEILFIQSQLDTRDENLIQRIRSMKKRGQL